MSNFGEPDLPNYLATYNQNVIVLDLTLTDPLLAYLLRKFIYF